MRRVLVEAAVAALVLSAGCGGDDGGRPGQAQVYDRIEATEDCQELQETFDRAAANNETAGSAEEREWTLGYMEAADERMKAVGCYDE